MQFSRILYLLFCTPARGDSIIIWTFIQCGTNVSNGGPTMTQHWPNVTIYKGGIPRHISHLKSSIRSVHICDISANKRRSANAGIILASVLDDEPALTTFKYVYQFEIVINVLVIALSALKGSIQHWISVSYLLVCWLHCRWSFSIILRTKLQKWRSTF